MHGRCDFKNSTRKISLFCGPINSWNSVREFNRCPFAVIGESFAVLWAATGPMGGNSHPDWSKFWVPCPKTTKRFDRQIHFKLLMNATHPNTTIFASNLDKIENWSWQEVGDKSPQSSPVARPLGLPGIFPASWLATNPLHCCLPYQK